jgi:hypothetical protein
MRISIISQMKNVNWHLVSLYRVRQEPCQQAKDAALKTVDLKKHMP